ncbi:MAG: DUF3179 domain-containing protein [Actinomycetota bacterium]
MQTNRLLALLLGLSLLIAACGDSEAEDGSTASDQAETEGASGAGDSGDGEDTSDQADGADDAAGNGEIDESDLFSPTETDAPLDLSGGATSSDEGVVIEADDPTTGLSGDLIQATAPWPTDWSRRTVDLGTLGLGIPSIDPRDRIPPIDLPKFEPIADATWLDDREPGALVDFGGEIRFYPLSILTRHEIVNDRFGDVPITVTYCPLCNTAIAFDARVDGQALRFGVSGLLRNSDLVMWDEGTTSLWQQITGEAIAGEFAGTRLDFLPTSIVSYGDARDSFPDALSLSRATGFDIPYGSNPYTGYSSTSQPFLFSGELDDRFPALSRVVGVNTEDGRKAYPFQLIEPEGVVNDTIGDLPVAVFWGGDTADALDQSTIADSAAIGTGIAFDRRVGDQLLTFTTGGDDLFVDDETGTTWSLLGLGIDGPLAGERLQVIDHRNEFWFAWAAFFPDASVYGG